MDFGFDLGGGSFVLRELGTGWWIYGLFYVGWALINYLKFEFYWLERGV